jgi:trans-aconitate 2-methyltransferase
MSDWDPDQYRRFATERAQPFWDIVELVDPTTVDRMVDLGCGDGALSVEAAAQIGAATLVGVDSSRR